jgi:hypothetical protein
MSKENVDLVFSTAEQAQAFRDMLQRERNEKEYNALLKSNAALYLDEVSDVIEYRRFMKDLFSRNIVIDERIASALDRIADKLGATDG